MNFDDFKWINPANIQLSHHGIEIEAPPATDFFIDPTGRATKLNAPFYYTEATGDFIISARVRHNFNNVYDACALMAFYDDQHWAKLCFEQTDFNTRAIVSVVTNGASDDANGPNIGEAAPWLQIAKKGNVMAMHYSLDNKKYDMVRLFSFPHGGAGSLKIGMVAQSPVGGSALMEFQHLTILPVTVENIRNGK